MLKNNSYINKLFKKIAETITAHKDDIISILCEVETYTTACNEVEKTVRTITSYSDENRYLVGRDPLGNVAVFLPFNMPLYSFILYAFGPAYIGNNVVVRPSRLTASQLIRICNYFLSELKELHISLFEGSGSEFISSIVNDNKYNCVIFTGRYDSVKDILSKLNPQTKLIYCGSGVCPLIIQDNADINLAVSVTISSRLFNSGQDCLATEKILIHDSMFDKYVRLLIDEAKKITVGELNDSNTVIGRLTDQTIYDNALRLLETSNVNILYDGGHSNQTISPVIVETTSFEPVFLHEKFAPIFPIVRFKNNDEMINIINGAEYQLGISVIGQGRFNEPFIASHIAYNSSVLSLEEADAHIPFGGYKKSGFVAENGRIKEGPILFSVETSKIQ